MSPRHEPRTQTCDREGAAARLRDARAQLQLAERPAGGGAEAEKAAVSCAVLAGIAAADAACCAALEQRSRAQDHRQAIALLRQIAPGGAEGAVQLQRLLGVKDRAHYGFEDVSGQQLKAAMRQARALVALAEAVLAR